MGKNGTATAVLPTIAKELAGLDHVPVSSLEPFQGDLKDLSEREYKKLRKSILENGIIVPFFVYLETGQLLDGHQRRRVMINEGWSLDVPVVYISADSEQDAKKKLLVISSQYGRITQEGFDSFSWDIEEDWIAETINFDALPFDFAEIEDIEFGEPDQERKSVVDDKQSQIKPVLCINQLEVFEKAIRATGVRNRGDAIMRICEAYLEKSGQFDL